MNRHRIAMPILAGATAVGLLSACLIQGQHTLVDISGSHAASARVDRIIFTFQQGVPTVNSAGYVTAPPAAPSGRPVTVDGARFVKVDLSPAVAHDSRGDSTAATAVYFPATTNVLQAKQFEDFEGHVGYVLGLREQRPGTHVTVTRTASTVEVDVPTS
jgi:hypothetical protein